MSFQVVLAVAVVVYVSPKGELLGWMLLLQPFLEISAVLSVHSIELVSGCEVDVFGDKDDDQWTAFEDEVLAASDQS